MNSDRHDAATEEEATEQEDPEVTATKWMAYRGAQLRNRRKANLLTMLLAVPFAVVAWDLQAWGLVLAWMNAPADLTTSTIWIAKVATVAWAWMLPHLLLAPLRWYLRDRWSVDPERFGFSSNKSDSGGEA